MEKYKVPIFILSILIVLAMIWNAVNEPGIKDLKGNFKEVALI